MSSLTKPIQTYQTKSNLPNQTYQTKPNLPNQAYQTKPTKPNLLNQTYKIKPTKPNLPNQTYQTKPTKPNLPNQTYSAKSSKITGQSSQRLGPWCLWQCFLKLLTIALKSTLLQGAGFFLRRLVLFASLPLDPRSFLTLMTLWPPVQTRSCPILHN